MLSSTFYVSPILGNTWDPDRSYFHTLQIRRQKTHLLNTLPIWCLRLHNIFNTGSAKINFLSIILIQKIAIYTNIPMHTFITPYIYLFVSNSPTCLYWPYCNFAPPLPPRGRSVPILTLERMRHRQAILLIRVVINYHGVARGSLYSKSY